jgi:Flp pilus assembly protein TadG
LVLFALWLPVLIGTAAASLDLALIVRAHTQLRAVASAAARAGAEQVSTVVLAVSDDFALAPDGNARNAALRVCDRYRQDGLDRVECDVNVSFIPLTVPSGGLPAVAAWADYMRRDPTQRGPGRTIHASVTVSAHRVQRLLFLAPVIRRPALELRATETAVLVTGP